MRINRFINEESQTAFAPKWDYVLGEDFLIKDLSYWDTVKDIILEKEKQILSTTSPISANAGSVDGYTGLGKNSLTSRFQHFNVFNWQEPELTPIKELITHKYLEFLQRLNAPRRKVWIQCWANVMRDGEVIQPHMHGARPFSYLGGHVCVTHNNTSTFYMHTVNQINSPGVYESKNEPGKITLFQSCIPHYTSVNNSGRERITIAFDFIVDEDPHNKNNLVLLDEGVEQNMYKYKVA